MKRTMVFFVLFGLLICAGTNLYADTVKMGYFMLPPHTFSKNGVAKGAGIAYFESVAAQMGHTVEWVGPLPLPRLTAYLKSGEQVDGTVGFPKIPAFESFLYYTDEPLYMGQPILGVAKKHSKLTKIDGIEDIKGFTIGLVKSSSGRYHPLIDNHRNLIKLQELGGDKWMEQNIEKLVSGRLDALFDRQQYTLPYVAATLNLGKEITILPMPSPPKPMFVTFSKTSKLGKALMEQYNASVSKTSLDYKALLQMELQSISK